MTKVPSKVAPSSPYQDRPLAVYRIRPNQLHHITTDPQMAGLEGATFDPITKTQVFRPIWLPREATVHVFVHLDNDAEDPSYDVYSQADIWAHENNEWQFVGVTARVELFDGRVGISSIWSVEQGEYYPGDDASQIWHVVPDRIREALTQALADESIVSGFKPDADLYNRGRIDTIGLDDCTENCVWRVRNEKGRLRALIPVNTTTDSYAQALSVLGLRRKYQANTALTAMALRELWDPSDPWGSTMNAAFDLCEVAQALGLKIDPDIHWEPSPFRDSRSLTGLKNLSREELNEYYSQQYDPYTADSEVNIPLDLINGVKDGSVIAHDIELAITILNRYLDIPEIAAKSY